MIQLTDAGGGKRSINPTDIAMIYFAKGLSPDGGRSSIIMGGPMRHFEETPQQVVQIISPYVRLIQLTLPKGPASDKCPAWFNVDAIGEIKKAATAASIRLTGRGGFIRVIESEEFVIDAINAAKAIIIAPPPNA